jgi:hypothetical protein
MSFIEVKNADIKGNDCCYFPDKSVEELKDICNFIQEAVGFNHLGYIKFTAASLHTVKNINFFVNEEKYNKNLDRKLQVAQNNIKRDITFVSTTCKRLNLFIKTMDSFLQFCQDIHIIDKWLCIDDNSSESDRMIMKEKYPFFEFIFKTPEQKGHAKSLNIMLEQVKTRHILLLEDDWLSSKPFYIEPYIDFLKENSYDQILFKQFYENFFPQIKIINNTSVFEYKYSPFHSGKNKLEKTYRNSYDIYEEEFEVYKKYPDPREKGFYYPGFSLNPGIFVLDKIRENNFTFKEDKSYNDSTELYFSFQCLDKNMKIAFSHIDIHHIGHGNSAYVLNDTKRSYDYV